MARRRRPPLTQAGAPAPRGAARALKSLPFVRKALLRKLARPEHKRAA